MTPIEPVADWRVDLADCRQWLAAWPDASVDSAVTDPPYEAEAHQDGRRQKRVRSEGTTIEYAPLPFAAITEDLRAEVARQLARICRERAVVFCQVEAVAAWRDAFDAAGMPYRRTIPWIKPGAMPSLHGRWPGQAFEVAVLAQHRSSSVRQPPCGGSPIWWSHPPPRSAASSHHPTTKPLPLMLDVVEALTHRGDLVIDPFAGSGTTGVACRRTGRRFVGCEIDPTYAEVARRKVGGEGVRVYATQASLF